MQPFTPERLAKLQLSLHTIDIDEVRAEKVLRRMTPDELRAEVRRLRRELASRP